MTAAYDRGAYPPIEIGDRLRIARRWAGLESQELADLMGVSRNTISNAESGRVKTRTIVINAWALACGVSRKWILTGEGPDGDDDPSSGLRIIRPRRFLSDERKHA